MSTYDEYMLLAESMTSLRELAAFHRVAVAALIDGQASTVEGGLVSGNYFETLGVSAELGRVLVPGDDAAGWDRPSVVISYDLWQRRLRGSPDVVGRSIGVNGADLQIVGVAARHFAGMQPGQFDQLWIPIGMADLALRDPNERPASVRAAGALWFDYIGRLAPNTSMERAQAEASVISRIVSDARVQKGRPDGTQVLVVDVRGDRLGPAAMAAFMSLPLLVLAVACVNATNILLARASRRRRDWAMRLTLGATRWRLVRQVLSETLVLSIVASAAGLLLVHWAVWLVERYIQQYVPIPLAIDWRVLVFTVFVAVLAALMSGLGAALTVARRASFQAIGNQSTFESPTISRVRSGLVGLQVAVCLGLLATGGQFIRTVHAEVGTIGVADAAQVFTASIDLGRLRYPRLAAEDFYDRLLFDVKRLPGVTAASLSSLGFWGAVDVSGQARFWLPGQETPRVRGGLAAFIRGDTFRVLGLSVLQGRTFTETDLRNPPTVAMVNEAFATRYLGGQALGHTLQLAPATADAPMTDVTIIGVVQTGSRPRNDALPVIFYPTPLRTEPALTLQLRAESPRDVVMSGVRGIVANLDPRVPFEISSLSDPQGNRGLERQWIAHSVTTLGLLALILAATGLYGVASFMVALQRHDIGVRMALGADSRTIIAMVLARALKPAVVGAFVGALGAVGIGRIVQSRLYGASPVDPVAFVGAMILLLTVMALATAFPAGRAARVGPLTVLRHD